MSEAHCTTVVHQGYEGHAACTCGWRSASVFVEDAARLATWHCLSISETIDNPYLHAFLAPITEEAVEALGPYASAYFAMRLRRDRLTAEYAWAIPTEAVVRRLADLSPICDLGCGTGYWAKLLMDVGAKVLAVDARPPLEDDNRWHQRTAGITQQRVTLRHFVDVIKGDATTYDVPADYTLMLCWPPLGSDMAAVALERYRGDRVIYVGEENGCTGDDTLRAMLDDQWHVIARHEIPQWPGLHDDVCVYARRTS